MYLGKNDYEKLPNTIQVHLQQPPSPLTVWHCLQEWKNLVELHVRDCDKLSVMNPKVPLHDAMPRPRCTGSWCGSLRWRCRSR